MANIDDLDLSETHATWRPAGPTTWELVIERLLGVVLTSCQEQGATRLLVDGRQLTHPPLTTVDRYGLGEALATGWHRHIKLALVGRPDQVDPQRFAALVASNRGLELKVALDEPEALEWLLSSE